MFSSRRLFLAIVLVTLAAFYIDLPSPFPVKLRLAGHQFSFTFKRPAIDLKLGPWRFQRDLTIHQGLDLVGGTHLTLEAEMKDIAPEDRPAALESAKEVIARRVDLYGVTEPLIQTSQLGDSYRIIVELPGLKDINQAIELIGQTAQLDFREPPPEATDPASLSILDYQPTGLTGKDLKKASVQFAQSGPNAGQPVVALRFTSEGAKKFAEITQRNVGKRLAIFLDQLPITAPVVNEPITSGEAVISGQFTTEQAKNLAIQLNAGALPVPIKVIEQKNIGATLGADSVKKSLRAGLVGLVLVVLFMWFNYGRLGLVADLALIIYGLITLALYKLIPVTLTLPGLAGFILSVGMAVDSNILIFERFKEERRTGKPVPLALELAFGRAWDSIKDANVCTLITCFILFNPFDWSFLVTSGMVRGFALTLGLGVVVSLFTGIVVTRTLLRVFIKERVKP